jgi:hypothetical protein
MKCKQSRMVRTQLSLKQITCNFVEASQQPPTHTNTSMASQNYSPNYISVSANWPLHSVPRARNPCINRPEPSFNTKKTCEQTVSFSQWASFYVTIGESCFGAWFIYWSRIYDEGKTRYRGSRGDQPKLLGGLWVNTTENLRKSREWGRPKFLAGKFLGIVVNFYWWSLLHTVSQGRKFWAVTSTCNVCQDRLTVWMGQREAKSKFLFHKLAYPYWSDGPILPLGSSLR